MNRLKSVLSSEFEELHGVLTAARGSPERHGLTGDEVRKIRSIALRWWSIVGNDPAEQQLVTAILRFCDASLAHREPIRILE